MSVLQVVFPCTFISIAVAPHEGSLTVFVAFDEVSCISVAVRIFENAFSRAFPLLVIAFIFIAILETIDSLSLLNIVAPLAFVNITVSINVYAIAAALVVFPFPFPAFLSFIHRPS